MNIDSNIAQLKHEIQQLTSTDRYTQQIRAMKQNQLNRLEASRKAQHAARKANASLKHA